MNKELQSIEMKHQTANRVIIHVGKNDIRKGQSEMLKQDFSELFETLQRLEVQSFISGPLPARGTNMFSRLLGLNTWLQRTCSTKGVNFIDNFNIFWGHRQLFKLDGLHPNKLGARVLKDNFYFSLRHPSVVCANPLTHSPGQNMSDHRTSYQLPSHYVVEESHKDTDNATQPKQALLMDILAEPCPQSSSHADCDVLQQLQDSAPKDDFLGNCLGSQDNTSQSPESPELEPRSPDTLSPSPASPLLSFSQKIEELVYCANPLTHSHGQNMSDHRTSYQLPSHYLVEEFHKDTDNATQPKQALLMDIPAEPCPQSSSHADCDVLQQLQDSTPKDDFLENSLGSQDNTSQSPETPELEPRSPDTLSLSPASPLLSFSQKMEELVYAGTKLSASPQILTKKTAGPPTTKDCRLSSPASSCESSPTAATTPGPKPSSICCRWTKNNW